MSTKVRTILLYVLTGILVATLGVAAVYDAVKGVGNIPLWAAIVIAVVCVGLLVLGTFECVTDVKKINASTTPKTPDPVITKEEVKVDPIPVTPVPTKKAPVTKKKTASTKTSTKKKK